MPITPAIGGRGRRIRIQGHLGVHGKFKANALAT